MMSLRLVGYSTQSHLLAPKNNHQPFDECQRKAARTLGFFKRTGSVEIFNFQVPFSKAPINLNFPFFDCEEFSISHLNATISNNSSLSPCCRIEIIRPKAWLRGGFYSAPSERSERHEPLVRSEIYRFVISSAFYDLRSAEAICKQGWLQ